MRYEGQSLPAGKAGMNDEGRKAGFTLVEVVVSLLIILAAVAGIFAGFVATQKYVSRSKRRNAVINYVRQELDNLKKEIRMSTWSNTANRLYAPAGESRTYTAKTNLPNFKALSSNDAITYSVETAADTAATAYRVVKITAKWVEPK